ncbi:MAG: deoxyribodipyrimidine photolyase [Actinobacteria bacterium HGW-Actinobacteria-7]|jgi:deoxyribodipyrimidine photo-lyase|nr:MAG: deoxyribodipyrimidine photolyase [Actinobacteria bacterium HGW-Actinobacteria-7]
MTVSICWFRRNLRLADNAALSAALSGSTVVVPVFIHRDAERPHDPGATSLAWLYHSLASLDASLRERGSGLTTRAGTPAAELARIAQECGASRVHCQRDWTPSGIAEETAVRDVLASVGVRLVVSEGQLLVTPDAVATRAGGPFRVFTPYFKAFNSIWEPPALLPAPVSLPRPTRMPVSSGPVSPRPGTPDIARWWTVGEDAAASRVGRFVSGALHAYASDRDRMDLHGTSELSASLAWGEISPSQVMAASLGAGDVAQPFVRQLAWREFSHHVLHYFPHTLDAPLRERFSAFPWCHDDAGVSAWQSGMTGYPLVDAGMRQLLTTGWMHNRVRLVCGSFLTKHLLQPWQTGAAFFEARLADYDPAANTFNWQWVAGCGADAAPYFRVFNPVVQGARFDPDGAYVRSWVPELAGLDARWIHRPWQAPARELASAGVELGKTYPSPIIDHAEARERALAAFASIKQR